MLPKPANAITGQNVTILHIQKSQCRSTKHRSITADAASATHQQLKINNLFKLSLRDKAVAIRNRTILHPCRIRHTSLLHYYLLPITSNQKDGEHIGKGKKTPLRQLARTSK